jgi:hypothetical protein
MANKTNTDDWYTKYLAANDKAQSYAKQIENREPFKFDVNSDPLYEQLKDQYTQQGKLAMMDTVGNVSALTGGYGNSYAQTAGQQVYNQYMGQLNSAIPELYESAYAKWQNEGNDLYNKYQLYAGQRDAVAASAPKEKSYKEQTASQDDIDRVLKKIANAENEDDLNDIYESLLAEGWGKDWLDIWANQKDRTIKANANLNGEYKAPHTIGSHGRYTY